MLEKFDKTVTVLFILPDTCHGAKTLPEIENL